MMGERTMKRFALLIVCVSLINCLFCIPGGAAEMDAQDGQILISETVEYIGNDTYYVERIFVPAIQPLVNTKTGTKTAQYIAGGTTIYTISVTGIFNYDGSTSEATSASYSIATYVEGATITSGNAYTSGASAIATGSVSYIGVTLQKTVTLTCDKDGKLS